VISAVESMFSTDMSQKGKAKSMVGVIHRINDRIFAQVTAAMLL
jgi:hypothetical protein